MTPRKLSCFFSPLALSLALLGAACGSAGDAESGGSGNVGFGGAQDIGQFRDLLDRGEIPGPSTLDANGFFNEHYAALPAADCGQPLCLHGMVSVNQDWLGESSQTLLRVALNTSIDPSELSAKPLDLVLVVDTSGSMAADQRLNYVKQGMELLIDGLSEGDRLGLVTYHSVGEIKAGLGEFAPESMKELVQGLSANGGTNIYEGMQLGMTMALQNLSPERQTRVILLSDGNITEGPGAEQVTELSERYVGDGIGLTTIGVGDNFNVELMRGLAESGAGNFYYVEDPSAVTEVFSEELSYFVTPIALGLEIEVQSDPSFALGKAVGAPRWERVGTTGGSLSVPAVFLSSRTDSGPDENGRRGGGSSVYIKMERREANELGSRLATLRASYRLPNSDEIVTQEVSVQNAVGDELPETGFVSHLEMLKAYAIYNLYTGLHRASTQAQNSYDCALGTLTTLRTSALRWNERNPDEDISDDIALIGQFEANLAERGATAGACDEVWEDDYYYDSTPVGCSTSGGTGSTGLAFFLLLLVFASRKSWLRRA